MTRPVDVVIVGGGIAGSSLATVLARRGVDVLLLERETAYRDRGYGEYLQPWGVAELMAAGLIDCLRRPDAVVGTEFLRFEGDAPGGPFVRAPLRLDQVLPEVPGSLQLDHPSVCASLNAAARAAGATVLGGVRSLAIQPGEPATVEYAVAGRAHCVRARVVVGADGRRSALRRIAGARLTTSATSVACDTLLLRDVSGWPSYRNAAGNHGGAHLLVAGRGSGRVRVYRFRVAGSAGDARERGEQLLDAVRAAARPWGSWPEQARPDGPCITYPMGDAVCSPSMSPNLVLVGDAAGWSNPLIGQGLSVAFADARRLADVLGSDRRHWPAGLVHHQREHQRLLRRLQVSAFVANGLQCDFTTAGAERRRRYAEQALAEPLLSVPLTSYVSGPLAAEAEAFSPAHRRRIRDVLTTTSLGRPAG